MSKVKEVGGAAGVAGTSELEDNVAGPFEIKNEDGKQMLLFETTDSNESITLSPSGNWETCGFKLDVARNSMYIRTPTNFWEAGSTRGGIISYVGSGQVIMEYLGAAGTSWMVRDDAGIFNQIDASHNYTHTLDDGENSVFKVTDNKGSPVTYLSLTQDGICQMGHTGGQTKLYAGELTLMPSNYLTQSQGYPKLNKLNTTDGGATTATINLFIQRSGPGQSHYVNPSSSSQVYTFSLRDKDDTGTESANGNWSYGEFTFQFHNVGSAACTVKTSTPNGTVKAVDASGASIGACDGTGFSVAANTTIGFRITKFNAKHTGATNAFNVFLVETLWTAANS